MFYAILGIIVIVALFLIFRDDHDDSYNKSEKGQRKAQQTRSFSHIQGQSQPKKEQTHYQKEAVNTAMKEAQKEARMTVSMRKEIFSQPMPTIRVSARATIVAAAKLQIMPFGIQFL